MTNYLYGSDFSYPTREGLQIDFKGATPADIVTRYFQSRGEDDQTLAETIREMYGDGGLRILAESAKLEYSGIDDEFAEAVRQAAAYILDWETIVD